MALTWSPVPALVVAASLVLTGCIALPEDPDSLPRPESFDNGDGTMTAEASEKQNVALCSGGSLLGGGDGAWCAERVITVQGTIAGVDAMGVQLDSFNGDVTAKAGSAGKWGFVATLTARASSEAEAVRKLDEIDFRWANEVQGAYVVQVEAKQKGRNAKDIGAKIEATLPPAIRYDVAAATANGDVTVSGLTTSLLNAMTSNGDVEAKASFVHANLATSNGDITGTLTPTASGDVNAATSNGKIRVKLTEGARYGYDLEGTTSNGEVDIGLKDGEVGPCPKGSEYYTPPCNHRTFLTDGYRSRDIRTHGVFATSNGDISLDPA